MFEYKAFHALMSGRSVRTVCMGHSMEPVYSNGDAITIHPFTAQRPDPEIGDVVHFYAGHGFNRHQVADILTGVKGDKWYVLHMGNGHFDQVVPRDYIRGYVIPEAMELARTEPKDIYRRRPK